MVDADSSQTIAIELIREGRNVVIQAPPGTGKSHTITNIIATAVLDGKKVLFLAEKLAALEVVNQRLERQGLGVLCLELHSNKARKSAVAGELKATWDLGNPSADGLNNLNDSLARQRASLNEHAHRFHAGPTSTQPSTFDHIGTLSYHGLPHGEEAPIQFPGAEQWLNQDIDNQKAFLSDLVIRLETVGDVRVHPWRGVALTRYTGLERQRLGEIITRLIATLDAQLQTASQLAQVMQTKAQTQRWLP